MRPRRRDSARYPGDKYPSLFAFYAVPLPGHTPAEMREAIHKEIDKLKTTDVTDAELQMYKTRARADLLRGLADNQGLANALAEYQTRYGDWRELFLQLDKVDKVTKADIRRVANQVFVASNRTSAEIDTEAPAAARKEAMEARNEEARVNEKCFRNSDNVLRCLRAWSCSITLQRAAEQAVGADSDSQAARLQAAAAEADRAEERNRRVFAGGPRAAVYVRVGADSRRIAGGDDPAKTGLVDLYGEAWRTSGTAKMDGDAMDDFLKPRPRTSRPAGTWTRPRSHGIR